jgi:hypothetical protein
MNEDHHNEITHLIKKHEDFLQNHADVLDSDLFTIYKELKNNFEDKVRECIGFKYDNEKILII